MFSPSLVTDRLDLVSMQPGHLDFVFEHFGTEEVHRYLVDEEPVRTIDDAKEIVAFYAREGLQRNRWVLTLRDEGLPIGTLGFHAYEERDRKIEIGYDLSPDWWGKGLMSEAVAAALAHAFEDLGVHRVEAFVHIDNHRSNALLERHGFTREGTIRAKHYAAGTWHDHHIYGLLAADL